MDQEHKFLTAPVAIIIAGIIIAGAILISSGTIKLQNPSKTNTAANTTPAPTNTAAIPIIASGPASVAPTAPGVKTFLEKANAEICKEDNKPIVYLFSTTWCPHCQWVNDTFNKVAKEYVNSGKIKAYHWEIDIKDDTLTTAKETEVPAKDLAIYQEFNPGGSIPTFVLGCKYFRVGNGYEQQQDLASEETEFRAAINDLLK